MPQNFPLGNSSSGLSPSIRFGCFLLLIYGIWRATSEHPNFGYKLTNIKTEQQLEEVLISGNFTVIGVYSSIKCPKCLTYFQKFTRIFEQIPSVKNFNITVALIDQTLFHNSQGRLELPLNTIPSLFFMRGPELQIFPEFSIIASQESYYGHEFKKLKNETLHFVDIVMPKLLEIESLEHLLTVLSEKHLLVLYMGGENGLFRQFVRVATENRDRFFAFTHNIDLMHEIAIYYQGYLPNKPVYVAVLRHGNELTKMDPESFVVIQPFLGDLDLSRLIKLECWPRLARLRDPLMFLKMVRDRMPIFAYVESAARDPKRTENLNKLIAFLAPKKKVALSTVIPQDSGIFYEGSIFNVLAGQSQDRLYAFAESPSAMSVHSTLRVISYEGSFEEADLLSFYHTYMVTKSITTVALTGLKKPLKKDVLELYKSIVIGRQVQIEQVNTLLSLQL